MSGYGFHWGPCDGRGRGGGGVVVAILAVLGLAAAGPAEVVSALVTVAEIVAIAAAVLLVAVSAVVVVVWRARRRRALAARPGPPRMVTAVREPVVLDGREARAAIEPPRSRVDAYPRIGAQPHVVTKREPRPRCANRDERRS